MVVRDYDSEGGVTLRFSRDSLGGVKAGAAPAQPEAMPADGETHTLTDEEASMLEAFRRFKMRMHNDGEAFRWMARKPEGVQIVEETALLVHPSEVPVVRTRSL